MTFLQPFFLLVCLLALFPLLRLGRGMMLSPALPGAWARLVAADMVALTRSNVIASRDRTGALAAGALWLTIGLALAEPVLREGHAGGTANLVGRVVVVDLSGQGNEAAVRSASAQVASSMPEIPVALVAATGDAFDVVPFTTDRQHINRYLSVLDQSVMPVGGHEPQRAIAHAEAMLVRAGMIGGQVVLVSGAVTVPNGQLARDRWHRAIVHVQPGGATPQSVQSMARQSGAMLVEASETDRIDETLRRTMVSLVEDTPELAGHTPLQPWLAGLACLLWLLQFRRPT